MKQSMLGMFAVGALTAWAQQQPAVEAKLVNEGVQLDGGSMGNFNLTYPLLNFGAMTSGPSPSRCASTATRPS